MKHKLTALLLTAGLVVAYAQRPGGPRGGFTPGEEGEMPPPAQALVEYLGLSDSQLESLAAIRDNTRDAAQPIVEEMRGKQMELREAIRSGADATTIGTLEVELRELRNQIDEIRANAALQAKGSLTEDQQAKVAALEAAAELQMEVRAAVGAGLIAAPEGDGPEFGPGPRGAGKAGPRGGRGKGGPGRFGPPNAE